MPFLLLNLQCQSTEVKALKEMKAYHHVYGFGRLQADCSGLGLALDPCTLPDSV